MRACGRQSACVCVRLFVCGVRAPPSSLACPSRKGALRAAPIVGTARARRCGRVLQHVPYVKTMFGAVMALKGACSQAVHNKERCTALAECVR